MTSTSFGTSSLPLPPGPRGMPLLGALPSIKGETHLALDRLVRRYGDVCLVRMGSVPVVLISHPDLLAEAFEKPALTDRWQTSALLSLTSGQSMAISNYGDSWRRMDSFSRHELFSADNMAMVCRKYAEPVVDELAESMGRKADADEPVDPNDMLSRSSFDLAFRQFFGDGWEDSEDFRRRQEILWDDMAWTRAAVNKPDPTEFLRWLRFLPNRPVKEAQKLKGVRESNFNFFIEGVRNRPGFNPAAPACLMDFMLAKEESGELSRQQIHNILMDLMMPHTDGVATTVKFFLLNVANRPAVQSRIQDEMDRVIGRDALPTVDDRPRLPYTFAAIAESMRHHTASPLGIAHRAAEDTEVGGYRVPAGAMVLSNLYGIHHDPRFWDSPHEFNPERFLPQADGSPAPALTSGAFIPFGVGHRRCTGELLGEIELWLYITRLLHRLRFERPGVAPLPEDEIHGLTILPKPYSLNAARRL